MSEPICEVIGCQCPAIYVRFADATGCSEDYLCAVCYERKLVHVPSHTEFYVLLSEYQALFQVDEMALKG